MHGKNYKNDSSLEQHILKFLDEECLLARIIDDCIYYHSNDANHFPLKKRNVEEFRIDFGEKSDTLLIELKSVSDSLSKKQYDQDHLAAHIFAEEQKLIEYFNYNIKVAYSCTERYVKDSLSLAVAEDYMDNDFLKGKLAFLFEVLIDLSTFVNQLYAWKQEQYEKMLADGKIQANVCLFRKDYRPHAWMRKRSSARDVFQNVQCSINRIQFYDNVDAVPVAMFQIRQAIELRLWEIFGISSICDDNGNLVKITADKLLCIAGLDKNVDFHAKLSDIKLIHAWTNVYVHAGRSAFHWQIDFAYHYLADFIIKPAIMKDDYTNALKEELEKNLCKGSYRIRYRERRDLITESDERKRIEFEKSIGIK